MRTYYYRGITCPNCHEPHVNGGAIEILDKSSLRCTSCGAKFKKTINLHSSELFPETLNYIIKREGENAKQYLSRIPLKWKIEPNIIEQAYIDWLSAETNGFFLITWPWHDVRFIPLLVFEYLMNNPGKRAAVIGNYSNYKEDKIEISPSSHSVFTNMIYTVNAESVSTKIKKEIKHLDRKLILKKEKVVDVIYKKIGANELKTKLFYKTLRKCKNEIIKEDSEFKEDLLRNITEHKLNGRSNTKEINKDGIWDVSLNEQERWTGDLKYNKIWLWDVLLNSTRLYTCKSTIPHLFYGEETDEKTTHKDIRLHFLSSEPDFATVLENVQEISPDILIIDNTDEIISDSRFGGERSKTLLQFLNKCSMKTVLMFSTNPDIRQFYKLNDNESLFQSIKVIPHTWDSPHIIDNLPAGNESKHPNPVSSNMSQIIKEKIRKITPEYVIVDSYNTIVETLDNCLSNLDDEFNRDIKIYFKRVLSTPLNIRREYQNPETLLVKKWRSDSLTYDLVMSRLYDALDQNIFISLDDTLKEIFQIGTPEQINPLREKIISTIENILDSSENWYITVVVYPSEVKGTERLLRRNDSIQDTAFSRISFCGWKNLASIEGTIPEGFRHCIISTRYPSIDYGLHSSSVDRFIFIGDEKGIGNIKDIIEKRLLEINAYPIIKPDDAATLPDLLNRSLSMINIPETGQLSEMYEDIMDEMEFIMPYSEFTDSGGVTGISGESKTHFKIKSEEPAILCIDSQNRGVFLPLNCSILIKDGSQFQEISIDGDPSLNSIKKNLMENEIILGRAGFYISFRSIFFEFMMKFGDKLQFQRGPFEWHGFRNLFNDSVHWNMILEKTVHEYAENNSLELRQSQNCIAAILADSGITAVNPDYIIGWWTNYEEVTLDSGIYRLYRVEHPFTRNDMRTIYSVLRNLCPDILSDIQVADRSYAAAISLQNLRRNSLKRHDKNIEAKYSAIYSQLEKQIMQIMKNAEMFRVIDVYKINVSCEVEPLRIFENYQDFIETNK
ncbi:MAG: hypothetical protein HF976_05195 [ANME-2 cluster archaeon]|nr:hypothetical protein [ANME-2 cluster archaeon]MBC2700802.1 hypothetical protein [ANME-2 cluster archaeon]MBC2707551.1 hypothetical protein [ANME-2 cluster archaeon]MBC2745874.1 hypothetical protein [ANME-2 cluster archaeon]